MRSPLGRILRPSARSTCGDIFEGTANVNRRQRRTRKRRERGGGLQGDGPVSGPGSGTGYNVHGDTCQITGRLALDRNDGGPAIFYGTLLDGTFFCSYPLIWD